MFALLGLLCFALASAEPVEKFFSPRIGFAFDNPLSRIVGGQPAAEKQFPYQVSLQYGNGPSNARHFCGGVIVAKRWIMTAAHCPKAIPSFGYFVVKAGKIKLDSTEAHEQVIKVARSYTHERYGGGVGPYDVGMLLLESPLEFNEYVQPIDLPEPQSSHTGNVVLSGWGSITPRYTIPNNLQYIELPLVDYETCKNSLNQLIGSSQNPLHPTNVCTGPLTGGKSPCAGDSGGPLVAMNPQTHKKEVIGIVSWGIVPCGTKGAPAVYTKTSAHSDWIALTMSNE